MTKFSRLSLVSLAVLLVGCGSTNQALSSPQLALIDSIDGTTAASTAHVAVNISTAGATGTVKVAGDGTFNFTKKLGEMTETITSAATVTPVAIDSIVDGTTIYEKLPPALTSQAGAAATAKPWYKVDLTTLGQKAGVNLGGLSSGQSGDPSQGLNMLRGAGKDVTVVGKEQVRGASTTHYHAVLDFDKAAAGESDATRKAALAQLAKVYNNQTIPVDVWVDSDKRVRKINYSVDTSKLNISTTSTTSAAEAQTVTESIEFYDFGTPVNVTVPAANQTTDLSSLTGSAS